MTARTLPGIGLTGDIDQGAPWKVAGDRNWLLSSVLTQLAVESATTSLPASPLNGVIYIVRVGDANANQVAARDNGAWVYFPPFEGLTAYVRDTNTLMNFDGDAWTPATAPLAAALATAATVPAYAFSAAEAQSIFDNALPKDSYADIRVDTSRAKSYRVLTPGISGNWRVDLSDTTSADNNGTILVRSDGARVKRDYSGGVRLEWFTPGATGAAALQNALDASTVVRVSSYLAINSAVTVSKSVTIIGDGPDAALDFSAGNGGLTVAGALTQIANLSADVLTGATVVSLTDATGVAADDVLIIWNPTAGSWFSVRAAYRAGEFLHVHSVSGNTLKLYGVLSDDYVAANVQVYKMTPVTVTAENLRLVESTSTAAPPLLVQFGKDCFFSNLRSRSSKYTALSLDRCYNTTVGALAATNNSPITGTDYGITISNCQKLTLTGGGLSASRHGIAIGGGVGVGSVPNRDFVISGCVVENVATEGVGGTDMHGNVQRIVYNNCIIRSHANMAGMDATYNSCTIFGRQGTVDGSCVFGAEIAGGLFTLSDCIMYSDGDWAGYGLIYLSPTNDMRADLHVSVTNLRVVSKQSGGVLGKLVYILARGANKKISVMVDGVHAIASQVLAVIYATDNVNPALASDYLIADNITIIGSNAPYLVYPTSHVASVPTRQMAQSGRVAVVTAAAASVLAASQTFKYRYSKEPVPALSCWNAAGAGIGLTAGKVAVPKAFQNTASSIWPAIYSADGANFTAAVNVNLGWHVGINEV